MLDTEQTATIVDRGLCNILRVSLLLELFRLGGSFRLNLFLRLEALVLLRLFHLLLR
jgi:hypothetical protein